MGNGSYLFYAALGRWSAVGGPLGRKRVQRRRRRADLRLEMGSEQFTFEIIANFMTFEIFQRLYY